MNSDSSPGSASDPSPSRSRRLAGALTLTLIASWLLMLAPLPLSLLSGLTGLLALVLLIVLVVRSIRERRYSTAVIGALLGVTATLLIIARAVLSLVFYGPMLELEQCRSSALTEQARVQCEAQVQDSMVDWVGGLFGP